jgi:hypothetical protein
MTDKKASVFQRWSDRKAKVRQGVNISDQEKPELEGYPNDKASDKTSDKDGIASHDADSDAHLSDTEMLEKWELPDPTDVHDEDKLDAFFKEGIPDRLKQLAMRRLWKINPFFGRVDEMVEYGEDYTDAATVIEGMKSAYEVGKGYTAKLMREAEEKRILEEEAKLKDLAKEAEAAAEHENRNENELSEGGHDENTAMASDEATIESQAEDQKAIRRDETADFLGQDQEMDQGEEAKDSKQKPSALSPKRPVFRPLS